jgi:hypothetical protein|nr:MAG TPA_asm: hypothetical protein [Caudoviricetes sp.]
MGIKFLQNIDAERNKFEEAGFEVVNQLPTDNLFVGRQVIYNGQLYVYNGSQWVNVNAPYEANLAWGGGNIQAGASPIDACLNPNRGNNIFGFFPAENIVIERSEDSGQTWSSSEISDEKKILLFTKDTELTVGYDMVRITLDCHGILYGTLLKIIISMSTGLAEDCYCKVQGLTYYKSANGLTGDTDYVNIAESRLTGWTNDNTINFSPVTVGYHSMTDNSYYRYLRFIFGSRSGHNLYIIKSIYGYTYQIYRASEFQKTGKLYTYDAYKNAYFPSSVVSKEIVNFDANIKPTQTGTVAKTSNWLWQYYAQSIAWLIRNYLPLTGGTMTGNLTVPKLIKSGGTATQALMADGSTKDISGFASSEDIPTQLPNPNPIIIKTADGVSVRYDGSTSGGIALEAGDNATVTGTQTDDNTMTVKFGAVVPPKLPNPQAMTIQVLDDAGAVIGSDILYDGLIAKILKLVAGYGIELSSVNLTGGQAVGINLKQIAGTTLLGNANGTTGTPQAVTMAQLRTMLGSLMLNDISVTLGGNSSYTLPCYIDYNGTRYQCRISSDATGLQIYRAGVWVTIGKFCRCSTRGTITNSNIDSWYKDTVPNYELDESVSAALFAEDLTTKFGASMAAWTGKTVTLNLASVNIKDTKSAWVMLKKNMGDCFPRDSVERIRYYYNVAIPSGEVVTKIELSYNKGVGMCTVHFYTEG